MPRHGTQRTVLTSGADTFFQGMKKGLVLAVMGVGEGTISEGFRGLLRFRAG